MLKPTEVDPTSYDFDARLRCVIDLYYCHVILRRDVVSLLELAQIQAGLGDEERILFFARSLHRAEFALIEFATLMFIYVALLPELNDANPPQFDIKKACKFLAGDKQRMGTTAALKFAVECLCSSHSISHKINFEGQEWKGFTHAATKRNGLMHPKRSSDLLLSIAEYTPVSNAMDWITNEIIQLFDEVDVIIQHFT